MGHANALHRKEAMIEKFKEQVQETINFLPPIPAITADLLAVLDDDDADFKTLARLISRDPSMAMNVLKIANSTFYGLPNMVTTIEQAVLILGMREISSLCMSCGMTASLNPPKKVETLDLGQFWRHSIATAVIAKILCRKLNAGRWDNLYLSGLVHDVGMIILDRFKHEAYKEIVALTYAENISVMEAERRVTGACHDVVGGWLMEKWKFPQVLVDVASYHHRVADAAEPSLVPVALIALADQFARCKEYGFGGYWNGVIITETEAFQVLEKKNPEIAELDIVKFVWDLDDAREEIEEMEQLFRSY
jgi:putative nucleotidyltransferase with HDIG domain